MSDRPTLRLATLLLVLTYVVIILGAATRVFDAGVSCPDWPHCYGVWNPFNPANMPPGGYVSLGVTYQWWQVALEWTHRFCVSIVSLVLLALLAGAWRRPRHEWAVLRIVLSLLIVQIALGGLTVLRGNVPWSVAVHLGTAMLLFGAIVWYRRAVAAGKPPYKVPAVTPGVRAALCALPCLVLLLMMVGAYVSSSHAGPVCGGLFSCGGQWWPADLPQHSHMMHRYLAFTLLLASGGLIALTKRQAPWLRHGAVVLHGMVWAQAGWGIATLYSFIYYPEWYRVLSLCHLAWGTLVWMIAVGLASNLAFGRQGRFHG
jgi:cytochrome c oxidase assembly protein subunit 15